MPETCDLTRDDLAPIILDALAHFDRKRYDLFDHVVMPDHVHVILRPVVHEGSTEPLSLILHSIKSFTAHAINRVLGRRGIFWQEESYDRAIRNEREYQELARYIYENPVKAVLVKDGRQWKWWRPGQSGH